MAFSTRCVLAAAISAVCASPPRADAKIWSVFPDGSGPVPTLQAGIDSAAWGDTVLAGPGTYLEAIDFDGKDIVVSSAAGAAATVLDASGLGGPVVRFSGGETRQAVLEGFTLTGGDHGILIDQAGPSVVGNVITGNAGSTEGGGILCTSQHSGLWSPRIEDNHIADNHASERGGGVCILEGSAPDMVGNVLIGNEAASGDGGGIYYRSRDDGAVFTENFLDGNTAGDQGGGIYAEGVGSEALVVDISWSIFWRNTAGGASHSGSSGGGLWLGSTGAYIHHLTVVQNAGNGPTSVYGGGIVLDGPGIPRLEKNIVALNTSGGGVRCGNGTTPIFRTNLAWQNTGGNGVAECAQWWQTNGNLIEDPLFCALGTGDFSLAEESPALFPGGGPMGAIILPGCSVTPVLPLTWGRLKTLHLRRP